jgi:hypothetical protein
MITNHSRCTGEIKSRIAMAKAAFNNKKTLCTCKFKEENSKVLHLEHSFVWYWNLDTLEIKSEIPGKFWNVALEKDGEDNLD